MNWESLQTLVVTYAVNILWALVIFVVGWWAARLASSLLKRTLSKNDQLDAGLIKFVANLVYFGVLVFAILAAFERLGVATTSFIAVLGAAGLAIGLALQGALANFAAGVLIILFRPYKVGDVVEVAGEFGTVEEVQLFNTVVISPHNKTIIIPNAQATGSNITNYSTRGILRLDMVFGIGYNDDLRRAKQILEEIMAADDRVLEDPPAKVAVLELGDNSVNFAVRPYVKINDYWGVHFDTTEQVKVRFDQEGISIPFPQRDVHLFQN